MRTLLALVIAGSLLALSACGASDDSGGAATTAAATSGPAADPCAKENLTLVEEGKLTIATDDPSFPPWFEGEEPGTPWSPKTPPTHKGYESAVAYAVAEGLGFTAEEVQWVAVPFAQSYKPGPKSFDFDVNQVSYNPARAKAVDFSESYYDVNQAVVTTKGSAIEDAASIADLKAGKLGAPVGTTSYDYIVNTIQPSQDPSVYDTLNDGVSALKAKQIDGLVVDFPTALYMAAVQVPNGKIVGRLPTVGEPEHFGLVFEKGNPLLPCVNDVLQALKEDGTLDSFEQEWITDRADAPVLE